MKTKKKKDEDKEEEDKVDKDKENEDKEDKGKEDEDEEDDDKEEEEERERRRPVGHCDKRQGKLSHPCPVVWQERGRGGRGSTGGAETSSTLTFLASAVTAHLFIRLVSFSFPLFFLASVLRLACILAQAPYPDITFLRQAVRSVRSARPFRPDCIAAREGFRPAYPGSGRSPSL